MRVALSPHPDFPCAVLAGLSVDVERPGPGQLLLRYQLEGVSADLVFPPASAVRADGLWKHTCLEAFVREPGATSYCELNASMAGWAAYRFAAYRQGMANADMGPPETALDGEGTRKVTFLARWDLDMPPEAPWQVGVTAVIEARDGTFSYWALRHPPGRPDFHNADCFTLELAAPQDP